MLRKREQRLGKGVNIFFSSGSQVVKEEMSFQVSLENCQEFSIPDEGGKFIPPTRNCE